MKKYFGESYRYLEGNAEQKKEAETYLNLWKKNLLDKLSRESFHCIIVDEEWTDRDAFYSSFFCNKNCMALRLCLEAEWDYEISKIYNNIKTPQ